MEQAAPRSVSVEPHLPLVGAIARAMARRLPPTVEMDELINDGVLGLIAALRRYDPVRRVGFSTYAGWRIRGAMLDGLRRRDPLPRTYRRLQRTYPGNWVQFVPIEEALMVPGGEDEDPESAAVEADLRRRLWLQLAALPPRDRRVLVLRMVRAMPLREVAAALAISITRVVEIQTRALARMRRLLACDLDASAQGAAPVSMRARRQEAAASLPNDATAQSPPAIPPPPVTVGAG